MTRTGSCGDAQGMPEYECNLRGGVNVRLAGRREAAGNGLAAGPLPLRQSWGVGVSSSRHGHVAKPPFRLCTTLSNEYLGITEHRE